MHRMWVKYYFFINVSVGSNKMNIRMSFYYIIVIKRDKWRGWTMGFTDLLGEMW